MNNASATNTRYARLNVSLSAASLPRKKIRFGLRISFVVVTIMTVLISAISIHFPWLYISNQNIQLLANQLSDEIISDVARELNNMFVSAYADQRIIASLFAQHTINLQDASRREALLLSFLKINPYYSFVAVGMGNGDFYGAQRKDATTLIAIASQWNTVKKRAKRSERVYIGNGTEYLFLRESIKENDYYAPNRIWFPLAMKSPNQDVITEPYVFASTGKLGVNTAITLEMDEQLIGVVNIAIEFTRISSYMRKLKIGKTGTAFMVTPSGELLAFREAHEEEKMQSAEKEQSQGLTEKSVGLVPKIDTIDHSLLAVATNAMRAEGINFKDIQTIRHLEYRDQRHTQQSYFVTLAPSGTNGWILGTVVPRADFTAKIEENRQKLWLAVSLSILLTCALAIVIAQRLFVRPLRQIVEQTQQIEKFDIDKIHPVETSIIEVHQLSNAVVQMSKGLASFGKYIPLDLVKTLLAQGIAAEISGENRTMSVLFIDLVGFTTISEEMGPKLVPFLGKYLGGMSDIIEQNSGTIDKYIGDAVMAFWGAPAYEESHATKSCRAALECFKQLEILRQEWPLSWRSALGIRIGINSGRVIVGNIGSSSRLNYTVLGDPVNLASRLEGTCKDYEVSCMIGPTTYELAKYDIIARKLDIYKIKGKHNSVPIYELLAMADDPASVGEYDWIKTFEAGVDCYHRQEWQKAKSYFEQTLTMRPEDRPSVIYLGRCEKNLT